MDTKELKLTLDSINNLFLQYTPEYQHIREIAEQDLGKELIDRIDKFLEDKKHVEIKEVKKIIFEDASKVGDQNINDIVDAFVRMRAQNTLDEVDSKSIHDILVLFNQWVAIGKGQQEKQIHLDLFPEAETQRKKEFSLEEEIMSFRGRMPNTEQLYRSQSIMPIERDIYSSGTGNNDIYQTMGIAADFVAREHVHDENCYLPSSSGALYKIH